MPEVFPVGMADLRIGREPDLLAVYGVGSCIIVAMYDPKSKTGGMAHVMLPDSSGIPQDKVNPRRFADTAVPLLFQMLGNAGVFRSAVWAKLIGGAEMFPPTDDFQLNVGKNNIKAATKALELLGVPLLAAEVGGAVGRSAEFDLATGAIRLTVLGEMVRVI